MAQFCPGIAKQDITSAYEDAAKRIREGSGDYFALGREYSYGEIHGGKRWSGRGATGAIYNLDSRSVTDNAIERYARYDQTHWYWSTDEHWSCESKFGNEVGRVALMFLKG